MAVTRYEFQQVQLMLTRLNDTIFGDEKTPGMDEKQRTILAWIEVQKAEAERRRQFWEKINLILVPILVTAFLGFMGQFIYFWIVLVPKLQMLVPGP